MKLQAGEISCRCPAKEQEIYENETENDEWFALYPCLCYTEQQAWMKT